LKNTDGPLPCPFGAVEFAHVASRLKPAAAAWEQADPADPILINMGISLRSLALPTLGRKSFLRSDD
jgi:hypothetical protein